MNKRIRYITTIFALDRIGQQTSITIWDNEDISEYLEEQEKHYGLELLSSKEEVMIVIEYTNIIWKYRIYYGSFKKRYKPLLKDDERWITIEKYLEFDLKMMGISQLKEKVLLSLKNKEYFEYKDKINEQFKKYCV